MGVERKTSISPDGTLMTAEHQLALGITEFRRTDNNSAKMNINGLAGGTPVIVWNGTGPADTGGDWGRTGIGSESPGSAHSGSRGLTTGAISANSNINFNNGSMIDVAGNYSELSFWVQPKLYPLGSRFRLGWLDDSADLVGNTVNFDEYISPELDVWQKVSIPISDFNLTGNVQALRFRFTDVFDQGYFLDDIELIPSGGGGPYRFRIGAPVNTRYHVSRITLVVSASETGWDDNKFVNLTSLANGLLLRQGRLSANELLWKVNSQHNVDLFGQFQPVDTFAFGNGKLLAEFQLVPTKASIIVTDDDVIEFVVRDDFSTLDHMRAYLQYGIENIVVE